MTLVIKSQVDARELTVERVKDAVRPVLSRWPIDRAWLFGSVARGTQEADSDVDIAVQLADGATIGWGISKLQWELEDVLLRDVDVITAPVSRRRPAFAASFERDKVLIYECA